MLPRFLRRANSFGLSEIRKKRLNFVKELEYQLQRNYDKNDNEIAIRIATKSDRSGTISRKVTCIIC